MEKYRQPSHIEAIRKFMGQYITYMNDGYKILYVDETSMNLGSKPKFGYERKNRRLVLKSKKKKSKNYSIITCITNEEVLGAMLVEGGVKGDVFFTFIVETIMKYNLSNEKYTIILDNAKVHKTIAYMQKYEQYINTLYLPSYSPSFNGIECFFGLFKSKVRRKEFKNVSDLIKVVNRTIYDISVLQLSGFELFVLKNIKKRMLGEEIII
jgi:transposase